MHLRIHFCIHVAYTFRHKTFDTANFCWEYKGPNLRYKRHLHIYIIGLKTILIYAIQYVVGTG